MQGPSSKKKGQSKASGGQSSAAKKDRKKQQSGVGAPSRRITGKTGAATATRSSLASATSLDGLSVATGGTGGSTKGSRESQSPVEKAQQTYNNNIQALDIEKMLRGGKLGNQRFQAERAITSLGKTKEGAVQKILLQSHLTMFLDAAKLLPNSVHRIPKPERVRILENLATHGISIPPHTRGGLLAAALDDLQSLAEKARLLRPPTRSTAEAFDPLAPTLATCGVSASEVGRLLQRCLVSEGYVPLLCKGSKTKADVLAASVYLIENWASLLKTDDAQEQQLDVMVEVAVREVLQVAKALVGILSERSSPSASLSTSQDVSAMVDAKEGLLLIVKKASLVLSP